MKGNFHVPFLEESERVTAPSYSAGGSNLSFLFDLFSVGLLMRNMEMLKLPDRTDWIFVSNPDVHIERMQEPNFLNLKQAIEWIKKERPIIWLGSIFSVPEPSGLPSGYALTKSLLELIFDSESSSGQQNQLIEAILPRWPLEALLDEFEFLDFDISESLLDFFKGVNDAVEWNALHEAITLYYQKGFASSPLCITSNWDTLQEKAFRDAGYSVEIGGPGEVPQAEFDKHEGNPKYIFLYHPHGSFETQDVVCSFKSEQRQLSLKPTFMNHPTLFLGYSGYEPSLYRRLESSKAGQLWCIHDRYLFSWDNIPGSDSGKFTDFLEQRYHIDWIKTAKIEKIDKSKIIKVSVEKNNLSLSLNNEKTKVNLKIDDGRSDEFIAKTEYGKLNIYHCSDLEIPAKRRLLCRPNTFVYAGDLRKLLQGLNVLEENVELQSKYITLKNDIIPPKIKEIVKLGIKASLDPAYCIKEFADTLKSSLKEPEATIRLRYVTLMRAIVNHIRNRISNPRLLSSLKDAAQSHDSAQIWISTLAYQLRNSDRVDSDTIKQLIKHADEAAKRAGKPWSDEDEAIYMLGVLLNRTQIYKSYVGMDEPIDDKMLINITLWYMYPPLVGSDMAAEGENIEILAFERLLKGQKVLARNNFDYAATSFYLRGLWNAGQLNEWAANNIESMVNLAKRNTLLIEMSGDYIDSWSIH